MLRLPGAVALRSGCGHRRLPRCDAATDAPSSRELYDVQIDTIRPDPNLTSPFNSGSSGLDGDEVVTDVADEDPCHRGRPAGGRRRAVSAQCQPLTTVLALDISGSMARTQQDDGGAAGGARCSSTNSSPRSDCGLILFDHEMRVTETPAGPGGPGRAPRQLRREIDPEPSRGAARPTSTPRLRRLEMLRAHQGRTGRRADDRRRRSEQRQSLDEVIEVARRPRCRSTPSASASRARTNR